MFARKGVMVVVMQKRSVSFWLTLPDKLEVVIFLLDKITISLLIKHLDITENEYRFNTQFLFRFTQMMTAITINGIMLIIPIYAGPRIALFAYSGLER